MIPENSLEDGKVVECRSFTKFIELTLINNNLRNCDNRESFGN